RTTDMKTLLTRALFAGVLLLAGLPLVAQEQAQPERDINDIRMPPSKTLGAGPWTYTTANERIRVVRIATVDHPWSIAFLPDGSMLLTERPGRLRIMRNGVLDPQPIPGIPTGLMTHGFDGLLDIALHPQFADNRLLYLTYSKK